MKDNAERPSLGAGSSSTRHSCNDCGEMPPCFPALASVRKELRGVAQCTPAHIIDGRIRNASVSELKSNQRREIPVRLCAATSNDRPAPCGVLHLTSHLFTDFKGVDPYVGADCHHELGRVVRKRIDGPRHDPSNRAAPTGMQCANVPARRMRDQHGHTVSRARSNANPFDPRNQRIAFLVRHQFGNVGGRDLAHLGPVDLPLLEEPSAAKPEVLGKLRAIFANRFIVIAKMEAQVERVERRRADPAHSRRESMPETVPIQKGGLQGAHVVVFSTPKLRSGSAGARRAPRRSCKFDQLRRQPSRSACAPAHVAALTPRDA